jgi:hypothetical protein
MSTETPRIEIYESLSGPIGHRFLGVFFGGKTRLSIFFHGDDREQLVAKMRDFWVSEREKEAKANGRLLALSAMARGRGNRKAESGGTP